MSNRQTPMLAQYLEIKAQHPGALLLFRMGDFYETFFEDAEKLAKLTGVVLTSRDRQSDHPVPLAGVPHHALDGYLGRLLAAGLTVAICEQVEDPAQAKGLVRREVVEIISPGTATAPELLPAASGVYCLAYLPVSGGQAGWALLDASTGDFRCGQEPIDLEALCELHAVREVILKEDLPRERLAEWRAARPEIVFTPVSAAWFHPRVAERTLREHFAVAHLDAFGLGEDGQEQAVGAAGALLRYLTSLSLQRPAQVTSLRFCAATGNLRLDEETLRNLEVFRTFAGERGPGTLIHHVDATLTPAGRRLLERRLAEPLLDLDELALWHGGVATVLDARDWRDQLRGILGRIGDLERLGGRAARGRLGPAPLRQLGLSLQGVQELAAAAQAPPRNHPIADWLGQLPPLEDLTARILATLPDEPPAQLRSGGCIRRGVHAELDQCRELAEDTRGFLADLQGKERQRTGIASLKVGFNKVFGYYFEVTRKHLDKVPADFEQKQTLVGGARFHTPALKEAEHKILSAEERAQELEQQLFEELLAAAGARLGELRKTAEIVAAVDLMTAFAQKAEECDFCRPWCDDSRIIDIRESRHPVVEQLLDHDFIPNDVRLDDQERQIILLTGPNMGGKSTFLRQVALCVLLAQAGSFVPAREARIGTADRIFTRVGASDNLARGQSTFYTEMSETAHILHQMSERSLVVLDEVGRGTSTYDGLSLAWAITEHLHDPAGPRPRTIFATHYHELTALADTLAGLVNMRMEVKEWEGRIVFLHSVHPGRSDRSYGIHVARLAGVPESVLRRAASILESLSLEDRRALSDGSLAGLADGAGLAAEGPARGQESRTADAQLSLFATEQDALARLRELDLEKISPVDAFMWLVKIKQQLEGGQ
jgi:DNA mismatch repair protein MutS